MSDIEASLENQPLLQKEIQIKHNKYGRVLTPIALLLSVLGTGLLLSSNQSNLYQGIVTFYIRVCILNINKSVFKSVHA
jgi:hypothetical protein